MKIDDIQPFLVEGIKFGQKEISDILSRSDDFNVGIEYEFRPTDEQKEQLDGWFKDYGIGHIRETTTEHDNMTEVITKKMNVTHAIDHLKKMFKLISDKAIEVPSMAGLHISISTNKYNLNDINMAKFLVLMNADYLHKIFPEREYTISISNKVLAGIDGPAVFDKTSIEDVEEQIVDLLGEKYQTIKISDYTVVDMAGRVELRFFGGRDYHKQLEEIKHEVLRSLFLLEIAYTDLHQKQYYREIYDLFFSGDKQLIKKVMDDPLSIRDIVNPSEAVQLAAVQQNCWAIEFISNPSEAVQLVAVQQNGLAIQHIDNPSETVQLAAVQEDGIAIKYIANPSEDVQISAVQQSARAIKYIDNPSESVQLAAVQENGYTIQYIDKPSEEIQLAAVQQNGIAVRHIDNPSEAVQLAAVQQDAYAIEYIANPSEAVQLAAVQESARAIQLIDNPSKAVQLAAVQENGRAIQLIDNPSKAVQLAAVQEDGYAIRFIANPSEAVQLAAVQEDGRAIKFIDNPTDKVRELHKELWS